MSVLMEMKKRETVRRLEKELAEARREYNHLLEMERHADPGFVEYVAYRIMAQEKRLEALRKELEMERAG